MRLDDVNRPDGFATNGAPPGSSRPSGEPVGADPDGSFTWALPENLMTAIRDWGCRQKTPIPVILLAALKSLLLRHNNGDSVSISSTILDAATGGAEGRDGWPHATVLRTDCS